MMLSTGGATSPAEPIGLSADHQERIRQMLNAIRVASGREPLSPSELPADSPPPSEETRARWRQMLNAIRVADGRDPLPMPAPEHREAA
jgi:hypothetical protein